MKRIRFLGLFVLVLLAAVALARPVQAADFLTLNADGYSTSLVVVNATDEPIAAAGVWGSWRDPVVDPHSLIRFEGWPDGDGSGGIRSLPDSPGLRMYTEVEDPNGIRVRIPELDPCPLDRGCDLYDALAGPEWRTFVYLEAPGGGSYELTAEDATGEVLLAADYFGSGPQIVELPDGALYARIRPASTWGVLEQHPIFAVGLISHQPAGELLLILPDPAGGAE